MRLCENLGLLQQTAKKFVQLEDIQLEQLTLVLDSRSHDDVASTPSERGIARSDPSRY